MCRAFNQRLLSIRMQLKIHPVTHRKLPFSSILITLLLHTVLGNGQMRFQKSEELVLVLENHIHNMNNSCARQIHGNGWWGVAIYCLEWGHFNGRVECSIVPPLCPMNKLRPLAWFISNKTPQVVFQRSVNYFSLTITLGVVRRAVTKLSTL